MQTKKTKTAKKQTRAQRSTANKAAHARAQATREKERKAKKPAAEAPKVTPYPQAGKKVTEFEEALDGKLAGTLAAAPGSAAAEQPAGPPDIDLKVIGQVCQIPFDLWSVSQAVDGLKLTDNESAMMAKPAKQLLDHYVPQIPVIAWAWISLSVVTYSAMKSRLLLIQEIKKAKADSQTETAEARGDFKPQEHGGSPPSPGSSASGKFPSMKTIKMERV